MSYNKKRPEGSIFNFLNLRKKRRRRKVIEIIEVIEDWENKFLLVANFYNKGDITPQQISLNLSELWSVNPVLLLTFITYRCWTIIKQKFSTRDNTPQQMTAEKISLNPLFLFMSLSV